MNIAEKLVELEALLAKATKGPWQLEDCDGSLRIYGGIFPGAKNAVVEVADIWRPDTKNGDEEKPTNAALIVFLVNEAAPLIRTLSSQLEEAREALKQIEKLGNLGGGKGTRAEQQAHLSAYGLASSIARKALGGDAT